MEYAFNLVDFENPSPLFRFEDRLKGLLGFILYNPFFSRFNLHGDENVLDFGCGGGAGALYLLRKLNDKGSMTCLDVSDFWMNRARKRLKKFKNIRFVRGDIREADIPERSFDIISSVHVIHDIHPRDRAATVRALAGKLKTGGRLFVLEPVKPSHGISIAELRTLMKNAGLTDIRAELKKSSYMGEFHKTSPDG